MWILEQVRELQLRSRRVAQSASLSGWLLWAYLVAWQMWLVPLVPLEAVRVEMVSCFFYDARGTSFVRKLLHRSAYVF